MSLSAIQKANYGRIIIFSPIYRTASMIFHYQTRESSVGILCMKQKTCLCLLPQGICWITMYLSVNLILSCMVESPAIQVLSSQHYKKEPAQQCRFFLNLLSTFQCTGKRYLIGIFQLATNGNTISQSGNLHFHRSK